MDKRELLKQEALERDRGIINEFRHYYDANWERDCDLAGGEIGIHFCETDYDKRKWRAFVQLTSSSPYRGAVGRQTKLFVTCDNYILGMVHLTSPLASLRVRDEYINFHDKWEQLNQIYNMQTCVPTRKYANLLTGKLLVYTVFSTTVSDYLKEKHGDTVLGYETTSLYGKGSMYNRIPFFKYLGKTDGLSAMCISDYEWRKIKKEYYQVYPNTETNRLAEVKFQIVDKLKAYYDKNNTEFPYTYESISFRRGVYFGYARNTSLKNSVNEWRDRWYHMRVNGGYKPNQRNNGDTRQLVLL